MVRQGGTGDQGQAMLLCLVSEDGDLSSSGSSISDEDRSRGRTNQRLIITIQMNVHSCMLHIQPELLGSSSTLPSRAALLRGLLPGVRRPHSPLLGSHGTRVRDDCVDH